MRRRFSLRKAPVPGIVNHQVTGLNEVSSYPHSFTHIKTSTPCSLSYEDFVVYTNKNFNYSHYPYFNYYYEYNCYDNFASISGIIIIIIFILHYHHHYHNDQHHFYNHNNTNNNDKLLLLLL